LGLASGVLGPVAFVGAWALSGAASTGYSAVDDPISELAAVGATTRVGMTLGFLAFAVGVGLYALASRSPLAGMTAAASVAAALLPLGGSLGDGAHGAAALAAYVSLAAMPLVERRWRWVSVVTGGALAASVFVPSANGLLQRIGLTAGDGWIMASSVWLLRRGTD
jgi:hypothetical protein